MNSTTSSSIRSSLLSPVVLGLICVAGLATTLVAVPAYAWSPTALLSFGVISMAVGALLLAGASKTPINPALRIVGLFCAVYGVCCFGGGLVGHHDPVFPLQAHRGTQTSHFTFWQSAKNGSEGVRLISRASAARQQTLIFWGAQECDRCERAFALPVLNPSVNPALRGYRLLAVSAEDEATTRLRRQFAVNKLPAVTILNEDGSFSGTAENGLEVTAATVALLLEREQH